MAATQTAEPMAEEGRALMTEREREIIAGEADVTTNYRYKVQSLVRNRVKKQLADDMDVLESHFTEVHDLVTEIVCDGKTSNPGGGISEGANPAAARRALDEIERALSEGDRNGIDDAVDRARKALEEDDLD